MRLGSTCLFAAILVVAAGCRDRNGDDDDDGGPGGGAENTTALCSDGTDNDGNGFADCNDFSCCSRVSCGGDTVCGRRDGGGGDGTACEGPSAPENTVAACSDGCSNDHATDTFADCEDFDCCQFRTDCPANTQCGRIRVAENSNATCSDGMDNDNDRAVDCADTGCAQRLVCTREITNARCSDGQGEDCENEDCQAEGIVVCNGTTPVPNLTAQQIATMVEARCANGVDEGLEGPMDCADRSCAWNFAGCVRAVPETTNALCANDEDDDLDGLKGCADPDCQQEGIAVCDGSTAVAVDAANYRTASTTECTNGANEDSAAEGDEPHADCADFGCSQNPDVDCAGENTNAECMDGVDNDVPPNGFVDCMDFSCAQNPAVTVCNVERDFAECGNGTDDDGNGRVDCDDYGCNPPNPNAFRSLNCMSGR